METHHVVYSIVFDEVRLAGELVVDIVLRTTTFIAEHNNVPRLHESPHGLEGFGHTGHLSQHASPRTFLNNDRQIFFAEVWNFIAICNFILQPGFAGFALNNLVIFPNVRRNDRDSCSTVEDCLKVLPSALVCSSQRPQRLRALLSEDLESWPRN